MKGRIIPMIGLAAVFGALSIFVASMWLESAAEKRLQDIKPVAQARPATPEIQFKTIVVAARALEFGTRLDETAVREIPWPQDSVPDGAFLSVADLKNAGNRVVLASIEKNEPVLLGKLSGTDGKAALSNLLRPGMRAVTLGVDEITGVGGFVTVGDHVDIVLTRKAETSEGKIEDSGNAGSIASVGQVTESVLEGVRVLSVDDDMAEQKSSRTRATPSVTVEVSAQGAQKIALAQSIGTLSLSLRPADDFGSGGAPVENITRADAPDEVRIDTETLKTVVVHRGMDPESYQVPSSVPVSTAQE